MRLRSVLLALAGFCAAALLPAAHIADAAPTRAITVYIVELGGGTLGCGDRLVAAKAATSGTPTIRTAMDMLVGLRGLPASQHNAVAGMSVVNAIVSGGTAAVSLTGSVGGVCDEPRVTAQIHATASALSGVKQVKVILNGKEVSFGPASQKTYARPSGNAAATTRAPTPYGTISGTLVHPSEGIPAGLQVCAERVDPLTPALTQCSADPSVKGRFTVSRAKATFRLQLLPGTYRIAARVGDDPLVYATEFTKCGMHIGCTSHSALSFAVASGRSLTGVVCCDFWSDPVRQRSGS